MVQQGCPLSPLIIILCLGPLTKAIRSHSDIHWFCFVFLQQSEYKLSFFVDDILLLLTSPHIYLPNLHNLLTIFGLLSGYKVNMSKTEDLTLHIPPSTLTTLQQNFSYH